MSTLKEEYKSFLEDIEKNIKNKEDLEYIRSRVVDFINVITEQKESATQYKEETISQLEEKVNRMEEKLAKMQFIIDNIEKDIYSDEGFDFEIICPYCDHEFIIDMDEDKTEIKCPECQNTIELDWSGDLDDSELGCSGGCSHCHGCEEEDDM